MPSAPSPITSPPSPPGQPWDATSTSPVGKWKSVDADAGTGGDHFAGLPDAGEGGWQQTLHRVAAMANNSHNGNANKGNAGNPSPAPQAAGKELATVKNADLANASYANLVY